jgi:hypothetical protein
VAKALFACALFVYYSCMAKPPKTIRRKKSGRPAAGQDTVMALRFAPTLVRTIDAWAKREGATSRSDAIRRLLEQALASSQPQRKRSTKSVTKAREMAGQELNRLIDESVSIEEQERRKRRLTRGPGEFRDIRGDLPKKR